MSRPAIADGTESGVVTRTRYGTSLGGDLGLSISANGSTTTAQVTLADPHGDVIATADVTATSTPAVGITGWVDQDEYGNPLAAGSAGSLTKGIGYGWVGAKQRATLDTGLLLMGARIYNPAVGGFTSTDPVYGGNTTTYAYPTDPINSFDLNGQWGFHSIMKWADRVNTVLSVAAAVGCGVCAVASAAISVTVGVYKVAHGDRSGWVDIGGAATFGVARGLSRFHAVQHARAIARFPKGVPNTGAANRAGRRAAASSSRRLYRNYVRRAHVVDRWYGRASLGWSAGGYYRHGW